MGCGCSSQDEGPINPNQVDASHFTMMKVVGKGGFGKVNAVTHRLTGCLMAMKRMKKSQLVKKRMYVVTSWRERDVMAQLRSPFLVNLLYAFQDEEHLFLIMPFLQGGDLRYYLTTRGRMSEAMCKFYACEVVLGLQELHSLNIVYRDMKPDNLLLDSTGHVRISDFGLGVILKKENDYKIGGAAGTPGYQAPEVLLRQRYGTPADLWSLGVTLYEFLERQRPFARNEDVLREHRIHFQQDVSPEAKSFIRALLEKDPAKRIGCGPDGYEEIKRHKWFADVDWVKVANRELTPPHVPELDRANCVADFELHDQFFSEKKEPDLTASEQANFRGYEFNVELTPEETARVHESNASKRRATAKQPVVLGEKGGEVHIIVREAKEAKETGRPISEIEDDGSPSVGASQWETERKGDVLEESPIIGTMR